MTDSDCASSQGKVTMNVCCKSLVKALQKSCANGESAVFTQASVEGLAQTGACAMSNCYDWFPSSAGATVTASAAATLSVYVWVYALAAAVLSLAHVL